MNLKNSMLLANMMSTGIPKIYKVLDWIESTGTQYINTGIEKTINTKTLLVCKSNDTSNNKVMFGLGGIAGQWFGTNGQYYGVGGTSGTTAILGNTKQTCDITILFKVSITVTIESETVTRTWRGSEPNNYYLLFGSGTTTTNSSSLIYSCQIRNYDNNVLLRNYIPVRRLSDNEVGMYDTVSKTFFGNAGTGKFIGSDEILLTVVGSPTITDGVVSGLTDKQDTVQTTNSIDVGDNAWELQLCLLNPTMKGTGIFRVNNSSNTRTTMSAGNGFNVYLNYPQYATSIKGLASQWNSAINASVLQVFLRISCSGKNENNEYPVTIGISTDGINWETHSENYPTTLAVGQIMFASSYASYETGYNVGYSLDFNRDKSYFKLSGTKYIFTLP